MTTLRIKRSLLIKLGLAASAILTAATGCGIGVDPYIATQATPPVAAPSALSYANYLAYPLGLSLASIAPTVTGTATSYSVSPALPAGLSLNATTGVIDGLPTAATSPAASFNTFTITATNSAGSATFPLQLMTVAGWVVNNSGAQTQDPTQSPNCQGLGLAAGQCTLPAAITLAQAAGWGYTSPVIFIEAGLGTIFPTPQYPPQLYLDSTNITSVTIVGQTELGVVIDGGLTTDLFEFIGISATLASLTLQNGLQTLSSTLIPYACGGALYFQGTGGANPLSIANVTFNGNQTNGQCYANSPVGVTGGAAISTHNTEGPITISNSTFSANQTGAGDAGAAIAVDTSSLGAATTLSITGSTFENNVSGGWSGSTTPIAGGAVLIGDTTAGNTDVILSVTDSYFTGNSGTGTPGDPGGAGIAVVQGITSAGVVNITNSTFTGDVSNSAEGTLAFMGTQTVTLTNVTLYGETGDTYSGIFTFNDESNTGGTPAVTANYLTAVNNTAVAGSTPGGVFGLLAGTQTVNNSLIANNINGLAPAVNCANGATTLTAGSYNVYDSVGGLCDTSGTSSAASSLAALNLDVGLAYNGGTVPTLALFSGSAAIDFIPNGSCTAGVTTDARGDPRPDPAGGSCDAGAFEF